VNILYKLTFSNGKIYIGQTVRSMNIRTSQHMTAVKANSLLPVHCAWRKHGAPDIEVIGEYANQDDLHAAEISTIAAMNTLAPNGYNIALGGGTAPSKSPSVAAKIAEKAMGRKHSTPRQQGIAEKLWENPEYREKVSAGLKAGWTDERRITTAAKFKAMWAKRKADGWVMPLETKKKLADLPVSDEAKAKMSAAAKGRKRGPMSETTKAAIAEKTRQKWQDPEHSSRRLEAIREAKARKAT